MSFQHLERSVYEKRCSIGEEVSQTSYTQSKDRREGKRRNSCKIVSTLDKRIYYSLLFINKHVRLIIFPLDFENKLKLKSGNPQTAR